VNDGVTSSLANDEICPLDNDNGHEERSMASILEHLALGVRLQRNRTQTADKLTNSRNDSVRT
jgi:hypothetical protein